MIALNVFAMVFCFGCAVSTMIYNSPIATMICLTCSAINAAIVYMHFVK